MSAPANLRSVRRTTLSAPRQRHSRRMLAAFGGPIVSTVTVPPWCSLTWRAISRALRSSGLKMAARAPRFIVPSLVIASPVMLWVSGTCLTSTTLSIGRESVIGVSGDRRPRRQLGVEACADCGRLPGGGRRSVRPARFGEGYPRAASARTPRRAPPGTRPSAALREHLDRHGQQRPARIRRDEAVGTEDEGCRDDKGVRKAERAHMACAQLRSRLAMDRVAGSTRAGRASTN